MTPLDAFAGDARRVVREARAFRPLPLGVGVGGETFWQVRLAANAFFCDVYLCSLRVCVVRLAAKD
jgi:hypothetical protein